MCARFAAVRLRGRAAVLPCGRTAVLPRGYAADRRSANAYVVNLAVQPCSLAGLQPCGHATLQMCGDWAVRTCDARLHGRVVRSVAGCGEIARCGYSASTLCDRVAEQRRGAVGSGAARWRGRVAQHPRCGTAVQYHGFPCDEPLGRPCSHALCGRAALQLFSCLFGQPCGHVTVQLCGHGFAIWFALNSCAFKAC